MPATSTTPAPLESQRFRRRDCEMPVPCSTGVLIGQIKLTRIHVAFLFLPGVRVKRNKKPSLYNVERSANPTLAGCDQQTLSLCFHTCVPIGIDDDHRTQPKEWWSLTGSNRRHPACKAGALPAELRPHCFATLHPILLDERSEDIGNRLPPRRRVNFDPRGTTNHFAWQNGWPGWTRTTDLTLIRRAL